MNCSCATILTQIIASAIMVSANLAPCLGTPTFPLSLLLVCMLPYRALDTFLLPASCICALLFFGPNLLLIPCCWCAALLCLGRPCWSPMQAHHAVTGCC